jgi:hypothetical protein
MEERDDVSVITNMLVHCDLHLKLSGTNLAMTGGILLVDELHREDGLVLLEGTCLFDATRCSQSEPLFSFASFDGNREKV